MTTLTLRRIKDDFIVTGPDIARPSLRAAVRRRTAACSVGGKVELARQFFDRRACRLEPGLPCAARRRLWSRTHGRGRHATPWPPRLNISGTGGLRHCDNCDKSRPVMPAAATFRPSLPISQVCHANPIKSPTWPPPERGRVGGQGVAELGPAASSGAVLIRTL
jgi:hypothetical protein